MRINTNVAALRACYHLGSTDSKLAMSLEKLSSGNKLIDIRDNPVGASMSVKMKTQIRNLDRASQNTSDGISVVQTAEGALTEIQSMLQRINELSVQGASDSYTDSDRVGIMDEISQIRDEIDRISTDTDFNTKTLLDGSLARKTYTYNDYSKVTYTSDGVKQGEYELLYEATEEQAAISTGNITAGSIPEGKININGATVEIEAGDSLTDIYNKFMDAGEKTGINVTYTGSLAGTAEFTFTQLEYGSAYSVDISTTQEIADALGLVDKSVSAVGKDGTVVGLYGDADNSLFGTSASFAVSGKEITIKDYNGFEMKIEMGEGMTQGNRYRVRTGVADAGSMIIQVGANEYQELEVSIPEVNSETLKLDEIRAYTSTGCGHAITIAQNAIERISEIRSKLGAYQNRMEHTVSSLETTEENMTASLSAIEDVDMADEMTKYTTYNVMTQAATSMLAQANQLPDKVLQLLQ